MARRTHPAREETPHFRQRLEEAVEPMGTGLGWAPGSSQRSWKPPDVFRFWVNIVSNLRFYTRHTANQERVLPPP